mgnify:CR=1 FL=1
MASFPEPVAGRRQHAARRVEHAQLTMTLGPRQSTLNRWCAGLGEILGDRQRKRLHLDREQLGAQDGLLYRNRSTPSPEEGAFGICSFWGAECLARGTRAALLGQTPLTMGQSLAAGLRKGLLDAGVPVRDRSTRPFPPCHRWRKPPGRSVV